MSAPLGWRRWASVGRLHDTSQRPRCLCVPGGVEMYVARHRQFLVKRMPETGSQHHASCPSFEPESQQSGWGGLLGEAVLESNRWSPAMEVKRNQGVICGAAL